MITLITQLISTIILKQFMIKFEDILMLSFFVPVIMAMAGNTGIQSSTLIVRGLALKTIDEDGVSNYYRTFNGFNDNIGILAVSGPHLLEEMMASYLLYI